MSNDLKGQRGAHTEAGTSRHDEPSNGISVPFGLKADCAMHEALFRRFPPSLFPSSQKTLFHFNTMGKCRTRLKGRTRSIAASIVSLILISISVPLILRVPGLFALP